jgi:hypothetical protein
MSNHSLRQYQSWLNQPKLQMWNQFAKLFLARRSLLKRDWTKQTLLNILIRSDNQFLTKMLKTTRVTKS